MDSFDVVIIGGGPGGYVCALRAARLGKKVALVEKRRRLGGTCLNVGCIPSKALLHLSEFAHTVLHRAEELGVHVENAHADVPALLRRKDATVAQLAKGIDTLFRRHRITRLAGTGSLRGGGLVHVQPLKGEGEPRDLRGDAIVIATGSIPVELPSLPFDGTRVVSSTEALDFATPPPRLAIVGAGAIGLELGSVWARLGSAVTFIELLPRIAPGFDDDVAAHLQRSFDRQGMAFELGARVTGLEDAPAGEPGLVLLAERDGQPVRVAADVILVAVGRAPFTDGLDLAAAGVRTDERSRIPVDSHFQTSAPGIYAIGDVTPGPMLAHKAEEEGVALAELLAGHAGHVNPDTIPNVVYTSPEAASVGLTEAAAAARGRAIRVGKFPLAANSRAVATDTTDGFVKVVADAATDRLLGVHIVAAQASELIAEAVAHLEYGGSAEDLARTIHAHPTTAEALKEAAMVASGLGALHIV